MGDKSAIEWTDATWTDRGGRRRRIYRRLDPTRPGQQLRRRMADSGLSWCRWCADWRASVDVRSGLCRDHRRAEQRAMYRRRPDVKHRKVARKRGIRALTAEARVWLTEQYGTACVYCGRPANTWDHVVPVARGGQTVHGNMVPACGSCNSSKRDRSLDEWSPPAPTDDYADALALAFELGVAA